MTSLAVNPARTTPFGSVPYITTDEYRRAPTAVDTSSLDAGGTGDEEDVELANVIARASSWADSLCNQVLAATADTETHANLRVDRDGFVSFVTKRFPILEVQAVSIGLRPSALSALDSTTAADIWIGQQVVKIPVATVTLPPPFGGIRRSSRLYATMRYVNGWPCTTVAADATAGTSLTVASALGIYAGTQLPIYDGLQSESVTVSAVAGSTLTLAAPGMANGHAKGVSVSALPPGVKQAVILLTSCLIQSRGDESIVLDSIDGGPSTVKTEYPGIADDIALAYKMLTNYRRVT